MFRNEGEIAGIQISRDVAEREFECTASKEVTKGLNTIAFGPLNRLLAARRQIP
jgi:hypothetical protein